MTNKEKEFLPLKIAVVTISDTRNEETDSSGEKLKNMIEKSGHIVTQKTIVKDEIDLISGKITELTTSGVNAIITTGGTGVTGRDVTPEALESIADKMIPGFGELFRMLSFQKIGTSTLQSRTCAGIVNGVYVFCLPGSNGAVKDAWNDILVYQLDIRHKPCNFAEMMPRLLEK